MLPEEISHIVNQYSNLENTKINRMRITHELSKFIEQNYHQTNKIYDYKVQCNEENNPPESERININIYYQQHRATNMTFKIKNIKLERKLKLEQIEKQAK